MGDFRTRRAARRRGRRARADARLAARPRARRPARDAQRHLRRATSASARDPRLPARDLRPPRHRASRRARASGSTRCSPTIARRVAALGPAEALRAARRGGRGRRHAVHARGSRRRCRGRSSCSTPPGASSLAATGTGSTVDWTWLPPRPGRRGGARWRIETPGATRRRGHARQSRRRRGALQLDRRDRRPQTISPNGDGQADTATISFTLTRRRQRDRHGRRRGRRDGRRARAADAGGRAGARTVSFDGARPRRRHLPRADPRARDRWPRGDDRLPVAVTRTLGRVVARHRRC